GRGKSAISSRPMHRLIAPAVVLLFALATFSGCICGGLRGSGTARTETRTVAPFQEIATNGSYAVDITVGGGPSVVVTADDNLLPHVLTTVDAGRLSIHTDQVVNPRTDIKVAIQTPSLTAVRVAGSSHATIRGITGDSFRLDVDGASDVRAEGA